MLVDVKIPNDELNQPKQYGDLLVDKCAQQYRFTILLHFQNRVVIFKLLSLIIALRHSIGTAPKSWNF